MKIDMSGIFNLSDRLQMESLTHRQRRVEITNANIANSETPGFKAIGYEFEEQLQTLLQENGDNAGILRTTESKHKLSPFVEKDGTLKPDVFYEKTESITHDGNTVDVDKQMSQLAKDQILYRTAVEAINKKIGTLRYAINGGRG